jgi:hypothetical protein
MYGAVAQLGEHLACTEKVAGSIPAGSTRWVVSQLGESRSALHGLVRVLCNPETFNVLIH